MPGNLMLRIFPLLTLLTCSIAGFATVPSAGAQQPSEMPDGSARPARQTNRPRRPTTEELLTSLMMEYGDHNNDQELDLAEIVALAGWLV